MAGLSDDLEGDSRPGHFRGVATVVARLFNLAGPCRAYFGEKDFQQLAVVRRMVADLAWPVEVVGCPTVREADGLAFSSRNAYLSADERRAATVLYRALGEGAAALAGGERKGDEVRHRMAEVVAVEPLARLDYAEVVDAATLVPLCTVAGEARLLHGGLGRRDPAHRQHGGRRRTGDDRHMKRRMMKSKIHRATVTGAQLDYAGSISIDTGLMKLADILEWEQVAVLDVDNGARFETYAIAGEPGQIQLNGAAARLVEVGHQVILVTYADYDDDELAGFEPLVVKVDAANRPA